MNTVRYGCTALAGTNKVGNLPKDEDGYYTVIVGALDVYNHSGAFYRLDTARKLFESSSSFMRRVNDGALKAEWGHPKHKPGMSKRQFISRVLQIDETNICASFKEIWLDHTSIKDENDKSVVTIMAKVKPSGPMGKYLQEMLDDPNQNVCFSIRSLTDDIPVGMVIHKHINIIVTFDAVIEPGISWAKKWNAPSLEALYDDVLVTEDFLRSISRYEEESCVAMESGSVTATSVLKELGWNKNRVLSKPRSIEW